MEEATGGRAARDVTTPALVTVVMPAYNCADYIGEALRSVLDQDYPALEVVVVDDGSTDGTKEAVAALHSDRITYLHQDNSGGPSAPRNAGIGRARGKYVAFFDADDIMLPSKMSRAVELLERAPEVGFVFTNFRKFDAAAGRRPEKFLDGYERFKGLPKKNIGDSLYVIAAQDAYEGLIDENYIGASSVVARRDVFGRAGTFDESLKGAEDFDMWLRILSAYDVGYVDMIGHLYRVRGDGMMSRGDGLLGPHRVRALRKQLERNQPGRVRHRIRESIAFHLWEIGYHHQISGDLVLARRYYASSIGEGELWRPCKGLLMTLLPARLIAALRKRLER